MCVALGEPFLGLKTQQGTVFYFSFEDKRSQVRKHFQDLGPDGSVPIFIFCGRSPEDLIEKMEASVC